MSGSQTPPSSKKPRSVFSRVVLISFIVAFVAVLVLVLMAWLMLSRPDSARADSADASAPQGVEIWQPNGASAVNQTYSLPPAADMNAASQASAPLANERPAAPRRAAAASAPAVQEVPIQPVSPQPETEIRPIEVPVKPAPQPQPRQPAGEGGGNPVDSLF